MMIRLKRGKDNQLATKKNESIGKDFHDEESNAIAKESSPVHADTLKKGAEHDTDPADDSTSSEIQSSDGPSLGSGHQRRRLSSDSKEPLELVSAPSLASSFNSNDGSSARKSMRPARRKRNKSITSASVSDADGSAQGRNGSWIPNPSDPEGKWIRNPARQLSLRNLAPSNSGDRESLLQRNGRQKSHRELMRTFSSDQFDPAKKPRNKPTKRRNSFGSAKTFEQAEFGKPEKEESSQQPPSPPVQKKKSTATRHKSFGSSEDAPEQTRVQRQNAETEKKDSGQPSLQRNKAARRHKSFGSAATFEVPNAAKSDWDKDLSKSSSHTTTTISAGTTRRNSFGSGRTFDRGLGNKQLSLREFGTRPQASERKMNKPKPERRGLNKRRSRRKLLEVDNNDGKKVAEVEEDEKKRVPAKEQEEEPTNDLSVFAESMNQSFQVSDLMEPDIKETEGNEKSDSYLQFNLSPTPKQRASVPLKTRPSSLSPTKTSNKPPKTKRRTSNMKKAPSQRNVSELIATFENPRGEEFEAGVTEREGNNDSHSYLQFNLSPARKRDISPSKEIRNVSRLRGREEREPVYPGSPAMSTDDKTVSSAISALTEDQTVRSEHTNASQQSKSPSNRSKSPRRKMLVSPVPQTSKNKVVAASPRSVDTDLSGRSKETSPRRRRAESPLKRTDSPLRRSDSPRRRATERLTGFLSPSRNRSPRRQQVRNGHISLDGDDDYEEDIDVHPPVRRPSSQLAADLTKQAKVPNLE